MPRQGSTAVRYLVLFIGVVLLGLGISLTIQANLGVNPWTVFHVGLANLTGLSVGRITQVVGVFLVFGGSLLLKQTPGIGTVINMVLVGASVDFFLQVAVVPAANSLVVQLVYLLAGILGIGFGTGMYISARLGAGPRDGIMLGLGRVLGWKVGRVRSLMEFTVLVTGFFMGGPVGLGTLLGVGVGPIIQVSLEWLDGLWARSTQGAGV